MTSILVSARHEMLNTRRTRTAHLLLFVFIGMVVASSVIGWVTNQIVTGVYEKVLAAGLTTAPNPFTGVTPLFYARNAVIYVMLIGSLMAIVLGVQATLRDRKAASGSCWPRRSPSVSPSAGSSSALSIPLRSAGRIPVE